MLKGDDGGFYMPVVDSQGNLSWAPSNSEMLPVESANIRGPIGPTGESGVYVGDTEPTNEEIRVWINPAGEASGALATKQYVDGLIETIELTPGPPGEPGQNYILTEADKSEIAGMVVVDTSTFATMAQVEAKGYQTEAEVNALINTALGVIENGTY